MLEGTSARELIARLWPRGPSLGTANDNDDNLSTMSDSVRVMARSHSPLPSRLAIGGSQRRRSRPDESGMTPGKSSCGGPPTGTTLHIKVPMIVAPHCRTVSIGATAAASAFLPFHLLSTSFFSLGARYPPVSPLFLFLPPHPPRFSRRLCSSVPRASFDPSAPPPSAPFLAIRRPTLSTERFLPLLFRLFLFRLVCASRTPLALRPPSAFHRISSSCRENYKLSY